MANEKREWIIQRCVSAVQNDYQDWPKYSEGLMTQDEMKAALAECSRKWPRFEFRGHNVMNQKAGYGEQLRLVY